MDKSRIEKIKVFCDEMADVHKSIFDSFDEKKYFWTTWAASKNRFNSALLRVLIQIKFKNTSTEFNKLHRDNVFKKSCVHLFRFTVLTYYSKILFLLNKNKFKKNDVVSIIKTFSYENSFNNDQFNDPFFPNLETITNEKNHGKPIRIVDPIGRLIHTVKECSKSESIHPFFLYLNFFDLLRCVRFLIFKPHFNIENKIYFQNKDITQECIKIISDDLKSPDALHSLLIYYAFKNIFKKFQVRFVWMSYELNPWERLVLIARNEVSKDTKIISYQQSVIPESSLNLFLTEKDNSISPRPDKLLLPGDEPVKILKEYGSYADIPIDASCAIRYGALNSYKLKNEKIEKTLLVGFEGVPESVRMADFVLKNINQLSDWKIIFRTHPALRWNLLSMGLQNPFQFKNIELSETKSVYEDLQRAGVMLYWGSTLSLEALKAGVPSIHLDMASEFSMDPLFDCNDNKWTIDLNSNLKTHLDQISEIELNKLNILRKAGADYIDRYFFPITIENMKKFASI